MLNREEIKGLKERIENHDFLPGFEAKTLLSHVSELEERLRKANTAFTAIGGGHGCPAWIKGICRQALAELSPSV